MTKTPGFGSFAPPHHGLVCGQFMPPHLGHQYLCDFASAYCDNLSIVIYDQRSDEIPASQRQRWMKELYPKANIHVAAACKSWQAPDAAAELALKWKLAIEGCLTQKPDVLFTSNDFGDTLASRLDVEHVLVDSRRQLVPVSSADLRENPYKYWNFLPALVRPHLVRRVVICGPESTGKSSLCRDLAAHYKTVWASEYLRTYLDNKKRQGLGLVCEPGDLPAVFHGQEASEAALAYQAKGVLLLDTDALQSLMYSRLYFGACPADLAKRASSAKRDLYLLLDVDVPWVYDPQRDMPHRRREIFDRMQAVLEEYQRPYVVIRGTWEKRLESACQAIDRLLG